MNRLLLIIILFTLSGCTSQPLVVDPLGDGMYNISKDFAAWMATEGDALVNTWKNGDGMTVFTRPYQTGWIAVMQTKWGERIGYFMSVSTWNTFIQYIKTAGFEVVARTVSTVKMPIFVMPAMIDGGYESILEMLSIGG